MYASALSVILLCYFVITSYAIVPQAQSGASSAVTISNDDTSTLSQDTTLNAMLNASSYFNSSGNDVGCWGKDTNFPTTNLANYFQAVQQILIRNDVLIPRQFYLGPAPEQRWRWRGASTGDQHQCLIVLANKLPLLTEPFPIILVAHVAAVIADRCITEAEGFAGGWASLGLRRGLVVVGNVGISLQ